MYYLFSIKSKVSYQFKLFSAFLLMFSSSISAQTDSTKVKVDVSDFNTTTIDREILKSLPFRGENNLYYTLFPGVTSQDFRGNDLLHIRGSRHDELAYYINGIDIRKLIMVQVNQLYLLIHLQSLAIKMNSLSSPAIFQLQT